MNDGLCITFFIVIIIMMMMMMIIIIIIIILIYWYISLETGDTVTLIENTLLLTDFH
jgi:hypothetical protein